MCNEKALLQLVNFNFITLKRFFIIRLQLGVKMKKKLFIQLKFDIKHINYFQLPVLIITTFIKPLAKAA